MPDHAPGAIVKSARSAARFGEPAGFREAGFGLVHRGDGVAAGREENSVAALTIGEAEDRAGRDQRGVFRDEFVGRCAVEIFRTAVALVPKFWIHAESKRRTVARDKSLSNPAGRGV